jgi:aspartate aminotransferase
MTATASPVALSRLASAVKPSATLASAARAKQMKAEGVPVLDFSIGEPDFSTPEHICKAAIKAMQDGHTRYTPPNGIPQLRTAVARSYQQNYGIRYTPEQVVISNGAKHSLHNALAALVGPGDEVILQAPYWTSYIDLIQLTGACPVVVDTHVDNLFKMTPQQLRGAITPASRLFLINSPSNPTGTVFTRQELEAIADVCLDAGLTIVSDEIYERLVFGDARATCFATLRPECADRTIVISGASKSYAMTGWRIGWALGPAHVIKAMGDIQSQETGSPCSISQDAALAALDSSQDGVEKMRREFEARRDLVCKRLNAIPGVRCPSPGGAFYAFFDVSSRLQKPIAGQPVFDSAGFCRLALESAQVNLMPGSAFGAEGFVRLSFAASRDQLNAGIDRLEKLLN